MDKFVKRVKEWTGGSKPPTPELSRSQYSLVSTGELTAEALQVWLKLPKKIKYDPELEPFQKRYEKEIASKQENIPLKFKNGSTPESKRLPLVKSAPHLNNNRVEEAPSIDGKLEGVEIHTPLKYSKENDLAPKSQSKMARARYYVKMTLLLSCWIFFTLIFMMYNEKEEIVRISSVNPGEIKSYPLNISVSQLSVCVQISGPFLSEQAEKKLNETVSEEYRKMDIWLETWSIDQLDDNVTTSEPCTILLQNTNLDFTQGEPRTAMLDIKTNATRGYSLRISTSANESAPFTITYTLNPLNVKIGVLYAFVLLCGLYVLIIFEILIFERNEEKTECKISVIDTTLEQENEVIYLGCMLNRGGRHEMDVDRHIADGNTFDGVLSCNNAVLVPTLLYGSKPGYY